VRPLGPISLVLSLLTIEPRRVPAQANAGLSRAGQTRSGADATWSPHHPRPSAPSTAEREFSAYCPAIDAALAEVALAIAAGQIGTDSRDVVNALRHAGAPYVWPHAWSLSGRTVDLGQAKQRLEAWLATFHEPGQRRCGFASTENGNDTTFAAVAVDVAADLSPIERRVRTGTWLDVKAHVLVPASSAKVVVAVPAGIPYHVPTSLGDGLARARVYVDRPGRWRFAVVLDGPSGPRPALEADVFVGIELPSRSYSDALPGDDVPDGTDPAAALTRMIAAAREEASLFPLARDVALDRLARAHATEMMRSSRLGHDIGDGDPVQRLARSGIAAREVGENVAHAANAASANRALWDSPSHRENILAPRFDHIGVGVTLATDGSLWVTEIFARLR
jgi:hypothetical protein